MRRLLAVLAAMIVVVVIGMQSASAFTVSENGWSMSRVCKEIGGTPQAGYNAWICAEVAGQDIERGGYDTLVYGQSEVDCFLGYDRVACLDIAVNSKLAFQVYSYQNTCYFNCPSAAFYGYGSTYAMSGDHCEGGSGNVFVDQVLGVTVEMPNGQFYYWREFDSTAQQVCFN